MPANDGEELTAEALRHLPRKVMRETGEAIIDEIMDIDVGEAPSDDVLAFRGAIIEKISEALGIHRGGDFMGMFAGIGSRKGMESAPHIDAHGDGDGDRLPPGVMKAEYFRGELDEEGYPKMYDPECMYIKTDEGWKVLKLGK